jgi:hypothetical protein
MEPTLDRSNRDIQHDGRIGVSHLLDVNQQQRPADVVWNHP